MLQTIQVGTALCPRNSDRYTNAVVFSVKPDKITVLSDFGNLIELSKDELAIRYRVNKTWLENQKIGYPVDRIPERIDQQIELLKEAKLAYVD